MVLCFALFSIFFTSCATVMPDQVGVKRKFGKLENNVRQPGLVGFNSGTGCVAHAIRA